jgi:hypothetical protein
LAIAIERQQQRPRGRSVYQQPCPALARPHHREGIVPGHRRAQKRTLAVAAFVMSRPFVAPPHNAVHAGQRFRYFDTSLSAKHLFFL